MLDTNMLIRAAVSEAGPAFELRSRIEAIPALALVLSGPLIEESGPLIEEVEEVLGRPYFVDRLNEPRRVRFLRLIADMVRLVVPNPGPSIVWQDRDDDAVLYTALSGRADIICTLNAKQFRSRAAEVFCAKHGIRVLSDVELFAELRSSEA